MIQNLFKTKIEYNNNINYDSLMPNKKRDDDIFIVSFPRSGNTWISFVLANIIIEKLELNIEVNFFNIHGFIPDIHQGQDIPLDLGFFPFKRMIKSHSSFHPGYKNVIYLIRDPRSVMLSYYKYLDGLGKFNNSLSTFIMDTNLGIGAWTDHVKGWLNGIVPGTRFRIFKYEDIKSRPDISISELAKLIGIGLSGNELQRVIDKSNFKNMEILEMKTGSLSVKKYDNNFKFVRSGSISEWNLELSQKDIFHITTAANSVMKQFGYQ